MTLLGECLKFLTLSGNQITAVPVERVYNMKFLEELRLEDNDLAVFPDVRSISATLSILNLANMQISSVPEEHVQFPDNQTDTLSIDLSGNQLQIFPQITSPGESSISVDMESNPDVICGQGMAWALADPRFSVSLVCAHPSAIAGKTFSKLQVEDIAVTTLLIGQLKDAVALHDAVNTTCTVIEKVTIQKRTVCSPFPTQLLLKLKGDFEIEGGFSIVVSVQYYGGGCGGADIAVYTDSDDVIDSCLTSAQSGKVHWPVKLCKLIQKHTEVDGNPTKCVFQCMKSTATYISFAVRSASVCDVDYYINS